MKAKLLISTVLLLAVCLLVPPFFQEGRAFDITAVSTNDCGKKVVLHSILFDNVTFTAFFLFFGYVGIVIPFIFEDVIKKNIWYKATGHLATLMGAWFIAGLCFEIANFAEPLKVYNDDSDQTFFNLCLLTFILGTVFIILHEKWNKLMQ